MDKTTGSSFYFKVSALTTDLWPLWLIDLEQWLEAVGLSTEEEEEGAGNVKSESVDEASEFSDLSARSSRTTGAEVTNVEDIEADLKKDFSCENWSDIENKQPGNKTWHQKMYCSMVLFTVSFFLSAYTHDFISIHLPLTSRDMF